MQKFLIRLGQIQNKGGSNIFLAWANSSPWLCSVLAKPEGTSRSAAFPWDAQEVPATTEAPSRVLYSKVQPNLLVLYGSCVRGLWPCNVFWGQPSSLVFLLCMTHSYAGFAAPSTLTEVEEKHKPKNFTAEFRSRCLLHLRLRPRSIDGGDGIFSLMSEIKQDYK